MHGCGRAHQGGPLILASLCGLSGIQHVRDIWRSQRAKPVPWGPGGGLPSHAPWGFWAAPFGPAACSSIWDVSTPWRKPTLRDAFISAIPGGPCARPAHATPWAAAPRVLPRTAANDLPRATANAASWAAAAGAKLPRIPGVWDRHPCRASGPGECPPCTALCPGLGPKGPTHVASWPLPARPGRGWGPDKGSVLHP